MCIRDRYSDASEIALRVVSRQAGVSRTEYIAQLKSQVRASIRLRERVAAEVFSRSGETNACRLIFSEADGLPDVYKRQQEISVEIDKNPRIWSPLRPIKYSDFSQS